MKLEKLIKARVKEKKIVIGYRSVMKCLKTEKPELVIVANNIPKDKRKVLEYNAKIAGVDVKEFNGDSTNLGLICGKPFTISVLAIKGKGR